jgi:hypothetical protein
MGYLGSKLLRMERACGVGIAALDVAGDFARRAAGNTDPLQ